MLLVDDKQSNEAQQKKGKYNGLLEDTSLLYLADESNIHSKGVLNLAQQGVAISYDAGFEWPQIIIILVCVLIIAGVGVLLCYCLSQEEEKEKEYEAEREQLEREREEAASKAEAEAENPAGEE